MDWRERLASYLTLGKLGGFVLATAGIVSVPLVFFDAWDRAKAASERDWSWLSDTATNPFTPVVLVALGVAWILFVGSPKEIQPQVAQVPSGVLVKGVRWKNRLTYLVGPNILDPYPFCPNHDVSLLCDAGGQLYEVTPDLWFGPPYNEFLYCADGGGHAIHPNTTWCARDVALEASQLLAAQRA